MLVRGWLIRKPVEKVKMAAEEPASRGVPPWHPHIRQTETKQGHFLNQGAKIMCKNQSEMRHFCTGGTQAVRSDGSGTSVSQGWWGASWLQRCWKGSVYWDVRVGLGCLCSNREFGRWFGCLKAPYLCLTPSRRLQLFSSESAETLELLKISKSPMVNHPSRLRGLAALSGMHYFLSRFLTFSCEVNRIKQPTWQTTLNCPKHSWPFKPQSEYPSWTCGRGLKYVFRQSWR